MSTIKVKEMTFDERTSYLFDAVDANDQAEAGRLAWTSGFYKHDEDGETALTKAIIQGETEMVKLLSEKAVINLKNQAGETPLTLAIKQKNPTIIDLVCKRGKTALKNDIDQAPLYLAVELGDLFVLQKLIDLGARVDVQSEGKTPLSKAVEKGDIRVVALLLKNGANPSITDQDGILPLSKAVAANNLPVAKILLKKSKQGNTDANWKNAIGEPVVQAAIRMKNPAMVQLLLNYGAQSNASNYFDNSSLHIAAELGEVEIVKMLLSQGVDNSLENMMGETAYDLAKSQNHQQVLTTLTEFESEGTAASTETERLAGFQE
ncbi:MAG: ankyrin repeat domain-containing protein [Bacteroidota bacterium]